MTTSLESALKTMKVDTGSANRLESDRYIGSGQNKVCYTWHGNDLVGRMVPPDSYYTKAPGCNSAEDRILIENQIVRPRYYEYIGLSSTGLTGSDGMYVSPYNGFGTGISSAIQSQTPMDRILVAEDIYLKSLS